MRADMVMENVVAEGNPSVIPEVAEADATYLTFDLDGQTFAVAVQRVREILDTQPLTRLPNTAHEIRGVIDVRGASVPIIDLSGRLGTSAAEEGLETRVIVFEIIDAEGQTRPMGVLADRVRDVCRIDASEIESAPDLTSNGMSQELVVGLSRKDGTLIVVIDLVQLFSDQTLHAY